MAEFKIVAEGIKTEIDAMSSAGDVINASGQITASISGMKTAEQFIAEAKQIYWLLDKYKSLVKKDTSDYTNAVDTAIQTDGSISI